VKLIIYTIIAICINIAYLVNYGANKWYLFVVTPLTFGGVIMWIINKPKK
jgi:hypothetical protein